MVKPHTISFAKLAQLMVNLGAFVREKRGLEFDRTNLIIHTTLLGLNDF